MGKAIGAIVSAVSETTTIREGERFDEKEVERYLRGLVDGLPAGSLEVRQFPAGASNLTYLLRIGAWQGVLRRPPMGPVPAKAHDMGREFDILNRLHEVYPLAPKPHFFCEGELAAIGAPFYVMEYCEGVVIDRSLPSKVEATEKLCREISETIVDTLVDLHAVDAHEAGLADIGRSGGFLGRQLKGWASRYEKAKTDDIPEVEPLVNWLAANMPQSPPATIIHNDFKINNLVLAPDDLTEVRAILDWEMATIGDPLFDVAVSLSYWTESEDPEDLKTSVPTVTSTSPHFFTRSEFIERYARRSGRDLSCMGWYVTFGYFKLAVIAQQIYARWRRGQTRDPRFASLGDRARFMILHARKLSQKGEL